MAVLRNAVKASLRFTTSNSLAQSQTLSFAHIASLQTESTFTTDHQTAFQNHAP